MTFDVIQLPHPSGGFAVPPDEWSRLTRLARARWSSIVKHPEWPGAEGVEPG